jgi:CRISPR-associated protein Cmr3
MTTWLIEPRDPLIVRDGKPIGGDARIETMPFPFPSTTAGAARTRMASPQGEFLLSKESAKKLLEIPVAGPIMAEVNAASGEAESFLFPAPRDALVLVEKDKDDKPKHLVTRRLMPKSMPPDSRTDSLVTYELWPIAAPGGEKAEKPFPDAPAYWRESPMLAWLKKTDGDDVKHSPDGLGISQLPTETRVHVAIQPGERVGMNGQLFQTKGLRFTQNQQPKGEPMKWGNVRQLALSIRTSGGTVHGAPMELRNELAPLGGERRLARWRKSEKKEWPKCPEEILEVIGKSKTARVVLVTPAVFKQGALPGWNGKSWPHGGNVIATVQGACVGRPEVVSGWDFAENKPKISRRLAPAGSVYFVRLKGSKEEIEQWARETWLSSVSDDEQDQRDGFGLAMVGVWEVAR